MEITKVKDVNIKLNTKLQNIYYCGIHYNNSNEECLFEYIKHQNIKTEDYIFIKFIFFKTFNILKDIIFDLIDIKIEYKDVVTFYLSVMSIRINLNYKKLLFFLNKNRKMSFIEYEQNNEIIERINVNIEHFDKLHDILKNNDFTSISITNNKFRFCKNNN